MVDLTGRVAVVTGAGQGIGRGVALALASSGASVVAAGRTRETLDDVCAAIAARGARALPVVCDVRQDDDLAALVARTIEELGGLDVLVNNAQTYRHAMLLDATDEDLESTFASGPYAVFRLMRLAHPYLSAHRR